MLFLKSVIAEDLLRKGEMLKEPENQFSAEYSGFSSDVLVIQILVEAHLILSIF